MCPGLHGELFWCVGVAAVSGLPKPPVAALRGSAPGLRGRDPVRGSRSSRYKSTLDRSHCRWVCPVAPSAIVCTLQPKFDRDQRAPYSVAHQPACSTPGVVEFLLKCTALGRRDGSLS